MSILIRGGRIIDPSQAIDAVGDVLLENGLVASLDAVGSQAETIVDDRGRVLLRAGCVLTPTMIACLERWTIGTISIEDLPVESSTPPPATDPPVPLNQRWNELFRRHEDSVEMQTMRSSPSNTASSWRLMA